MATSSAQRGLRSFPQGAFDLAAALDAKAASGLSISVCIPARNEEPTVGAVVAAIRSALVDAAPLVDEVVVVDDHSTDGTAAVAAAAGAHVVDAATVLAHHGEGHGKGEALWKSLHESTGDVVVWVDAVDIVEFDPAFVVQMAAPPGRPRPPVREAGHYHWAEADGVGAGVLHRAARPPAAVALLPGARGGGQPWPASTRGAPFAAAPPALRRRVRGRRRPAHRCGPIGRDRPRRRAQVDLGVRHHRNRTLDELGPQALAVGQATLTAGAPARAGGPPPARPRAAARAHARAPPLDALDG
ncbi:MAG: glycosyltransferase [Acidimicrobiales bacterium]